LTVVAAVTADLKARKDFNHMSLINEPETNLSVRAQINSQNMSRYQWEIVLLCTAINMLDGYDVLVMSFAAASVAQDWQLDPARLGLLLSAGLVGMAVGSIILGALADKLGRKSLVQVCLVTVTAGMILSGYSQNEQQLLVLRFITGIGIGGMLATLTTLVAEYSSDKTPWHQHGLTASRIPIGRVTRRLYRGLPRSTRRLAVLVF
jgi:sugar phosphate permease